MCLVRNPVWPHQSSRRCCDQALKFDRDPESVITKNPGGIFPCFRIYALGVVGLRGFHRTISESSWQRTRQEKIVFNLSLPTIDSGTAVIVESRAALPEQRP